jgi:hypothetical protein
VKFHVIPEFLADIPNIYKEMLGMKKTKKKNLN